MKKIWSSRIYPQEVTEAIAAAKAWAATVEPTEDDRIKGKRILCTIESMEPPNYNKHSYCLGATAQGYPRMIAKYVLTKLVEWKGPEAEKHKKAILDFHHSKYCIFPEPIQDAIDCIERGSAWGAVRDPQDHIVHDTIFDFEPNRERLAAEGISQFEADKRLIRIILQNWKFYGAEARHIKEVLRNYIGEKVYYQKPK